MKEIPEVYTTKQTTDIYLPTFKPNFIDNITGNKPTILKVKARLQTRNRGKSWSFVW